MDVFAQTERTLSSEIYAKISILCGSMKQVLWLGPECG